MNKWLCVGNIASDPDYRTTPNGVSCCTFRVACQRKYKNQSGVYEADFINCVAWRQTADFIHKYFLKGHKIGFSATLQSRSYDAQDGSKRYVTEAIVEEVEFVAPRSDSGGGSYGQPSPPPAQAQPQQRNEQQRMDLASQGFQEVDDDDELPF
jgi:single-strand DNA-binding protein